MLESHSFGFNAPAGTLHGSMLLIPLAPRWQSFTKPHLGTNFTQPQQFEIRMCEDCMQSLHGNVHTIKAQPYWTAKARVRLLKLGMKEKP